MQIALDEVMKGRTTFVIAHRLVDRPQRHPDPAVEDGRIVEAGRFDELVARGGPSPKPPRTQFMIPPG